MDAKLIDLIERLVTICRELSRESTDARDYRKSDAYESAAYYLECAADFIRKEN